MKTVRTIERFSERTVGVAISVVGVNLAVPLWIWLIYDASKVAERGGASATSGSGGPASPRMHIKNALIRYRDRTDDSDRVETVLKRFRTSKTGHVSESDKDLILDDVEAYAKETGNVSPTVVRDALGR